MKLTILHLTDLHVKNRIFNIDEKVDSLVKIINSDAFSDNVLLLFSGDLSFSGAKEQFVIVEKFISAVESKIKKTFFLAVCPGNHDRQFPNGTNMASDFALKINADNYCDIYEQYKYLNDNYYDFQGRLNGSRFYKKINEVLGCYTFDFNDEKVCVYCLNNSMLSTFYGKDQNNVKVPVFVPKDKLTFKRGNECFSILLTHIPLADMRDDVRNYLKDKCKKHIDIIVDGHTHQEELSLHGDGVLEITSAALHIGDASGFSLIHVDDSKLSLKTYEFDDDSLSYQKKNDDFKEDLCPKLSTTDGFFLSSDIFSELNEKKKIGGYEIRLDEIFVFPKLVEKKYLNSNKKTISSYKEFVDAMNKKTVAFIYGEQESGKTLLAKEIFLNYVKIDCNPVICDGSIFNKKKTKKTTKELFESQIKHNYSNENIVENYFESKNAKIIIIDNAEGIAENTLVELSNYFDKIIMFLNPDADDIFTVNSTTQLPSISLNIEFFYREKREELYEKLYHAIGRKKPEILNRYTLEEFVLRVECAVEKMEQKIVIDLNSLIDFCGSALVNIDTINGSDTNFIGNRYQIILSEYLSNESIVKISPVAIERITAKIAYKMYEGNQSTFDETLFEQIKNDYSQEYDESLRTYPTKRIIQILIDLRIIKTYGNNYMFNSRNVFAHFIGYHAMHKFDNDDDSSFLEKIISNGVYLPLNFAILMDIAVSRNNEKILNRFIAMLSEDMESYTFVNKNVQSISIYFDAEKKRVAEIDASDIKKRRQALSKNEEKQRQEYLDNCDNYFYEKTASKETKELIETFNKSRILAILMNHGDMLKQKQKEKLCSLNLIYPNIVIDRYIASIKKSFDDLYFRILDNIEETKADKKFEKDFNSFFDFLLSFVTATILGVYDASVRPITSSVMTKMLVSFVCDKTKNINPFMPDIQRLMILSFSRDLNNVYKELKRYIDSTDNKYFAQCAYLIGRRVVMDNYDDIRKNNRPFIEYIKSKSSNQSNIKLLTRKNRI